MDAHCSQLVANTSSKQIVIAYNQQLFVTNNHGTHDLQLVMQLLMHNNWYKRNYYNQ